MGKKREKSYTIEFKKLKKMSGANYNKLNDKIMSKNSPEKRGHPHIWNDSLKKETSARSAHTDNYYKRKRI